MSQRGKLLTFLLLGLLVSSFFIGVVSAKFSEGDIVPQSVKDALSSWQFGKLDPGFAKILIFLIVFLVIFLLMENIFGDKNRWITTSLSIIIAFLATAYLTPAEVLSLMTSYAALGLTITTLIPLALLAGLTYQSTKPDSNITLVLIQWLAWGLFLVYSIYKLISAALSDQLYSIGVAIIVFGSAIAAFIMIVFNKQILRLITKKFIEAESVRAHREIGESVNFMRETAGAYRKLADKDASTHEGEQ